MERQDYANNYKQLDDQYQLAWKSLHEDIADYILPRRGNFVNRGKPYESSNVKRADAIINDTGTRANRILASGMQGGLCSPVRRWFRLGLDDSDLSKWGPVREWLAIAEDRVYRVYAGSNFYTEIHRAFEEQSGFGTTVIIQEENFDNIINFIVFTAGEYRLEDNEGGKVDTCYRHYWMTSRQMVAMFGAESVSDSILNSYKKNPYEYFEVIRCIRPRGTYYSGGSNRSMPYESVWFENGGDTNKLLRISGYMERPFAAPRWSPSGNSPYGLGPGHDALGNIKLLQEMEKTGIKAIHKEVDPPLAVPSTFKDVLNQLPGAINYYDGGEVGVEPLMKVQYNLRNAEYKIEKIEARIERTFYNDIFNMIINAEAQGRQITATEILERKEEKLILIGPTIERQMMELLDPMLARTFSILYRKGLIPEPPEEILKGGNTLQPIYVGVLAQAQRLSDARNMQLYSDEAMKIAGLDEQSVVVTNWEEYQKKFGDILGVPHGIIRADDEIALIKEQLAQQKAELEAQQAMMQKALMMKELARADTSGGNALSDIGEQLGGGQAQ
jgi:hypothetical protein